MSGEKRRDRGREGRAGRKGADGDCLGAEDEGCGRRWRRTGGGALVGWIDGLGGNEEIPRWETTRWSVAAGMDGTSP